MAELEQQLRRYADQVERDVGPTSARATGPRRVVRGRMLVASAVVVLACIAGVWVVADRDADLEIEPSDPVTTTSAPPPTTTTPSDPAPEAGIGSWTPPGEALDPGPLSPRSAAAVVATAAEVHVWGGTVESANSGRPDLASGQFVDGAVYDRVTTEWRMMAPSPLPANQFSAVGVPFVERILFARGDATSFYDRATDSWSPVATAPFAIQELVGDDRASPLAYGERGAASFDLSRGEWTLLGEPADAATLVQHAWSGSTLYRVRQGDTFVIEEWSTEAEAWQVRHSVGARTAFFYDLAWVDDGDDSHLALVSENQSVITYRPSTGTFTTLPSLPGGGDEGGPQVDVVERELLVRWAPNLYRFDGEDWAASLLPSGLGRAVFGRRDAATELWRFGLRPQDVGGGNYFSVQPVSDLSTMQTAPFDAGPLSPRHDALVMRLPTQLLVWGGDVEPRNVGRVDLSSAQFADGAVLDLDSGLWRMMAPGPLPAIDRTPQGVQLGDGRILVVRGQAAALYDLTEDEWTEIDDAPYEIWEIEAMPEIDGIAASGLGGVAWFDAATLSWRDTGAEPAAALNRRLAWTGRELISVWGSITGTFRVEGWEPGGEWTERGLVETGVSQVAVDVEWIEDEVWIVGYAMTVDAWDPVSGTSRSLPSLPIEFQEGIPEITSTSDGRVLVHRSPGIAVWTGTGWVVAPAASTAGLLDGDIGPGFGGEDVLWRFRLGMEEGEGNRLDVLELPTRRPGEIQVGSFVLGLGESDVLLGMGVNEAESGRVFDPWADVVSADDIGDAQCRFSYSGGNVRVPDGSAAVQSHIVIGAWALIVDCDRPVDVARFLPRVRHIWADPELRPVVLDGADGVIPEPSEPAS